MLAPHPAQPHAMLLRLPAVAQCVMSFMCALTTMQDTHHVLSEVHQAGSSTHLQSCAQHPT